MIKDAYTHCDKCHGACVSELTGEPCSCAKRPPTLQRTGRTTRMMQAAVKAAERGHAVYIVMNSRQDVHRMIKMLLWEFKGSQGDFCASGIHVETPSSMGLAPYLNPPRGMHPNCRIFIDHFVAEVRMEQLARIAGMWDEGAPPCEGVTPEYPARERRAFENDPTFRGPTFGAPPFRGIKP